MIEPANGTTRNLQAFLDSKVDAPVGNNDDKHDHGFGGGTLCASRIPTFHLSNWLVRCDGRAMEPLNTGL